MTNTTMSNEKVSRDKIALVVVGAIAAVAIGVAIGALNAPRTPMPVVQTGPAATAVPQTTPAPQAAIPAPSAPCSSGVVIAGECVLGEGAQQYAAGIVKPNARVTGFVADASRASIPDQGCDATTVGQKRVINGTAYRCGKKKK